MWCVQICPESGWLVKAHGLEQIFDFVCFKKKCNIAGKIESVQAYKFKTLYQHCQMTILRLSQTQPTRVTRKECKDFHFYSRCHSSSLGNFRSFYYWGVYCKALIFSRQFWFFRDIFFLSIIFLPSLLEVSSLPLLARLELHAKAVYQQKKRMEIYLLLTQ